MNLEGPWYTLEEAQEILGLRFSELAHQITLGAIKPVLYTKARDMLIHGRDASGWTVFGICRYRGHVTAHPGVITSLLDGEEVFIGKGAVKLLESGGVQTTWSTYPFKRQLPHPPICAWVEEELSAEDCTRVLATPMPKEFEPIMSKLKRTADHIAGIQQGKIPSGTGTNPAVPLVENMELNFRTGYPFSPDGLRVPASEIARYTNAAKIQGVIEASPGERENGLHTIFRRLLQLHPNAKAKVLWALLREDMDAEVPQFDIEGVIIAMDERCIEWESRKGVMQSMKYTSFAPTLSRIRSEK